MSAPRLPFGDEDFVAWLDGEIDEPRRTEVGEWLRDHPDDLRRVETWRAQTAALRAVLDPVAAEPVPPRVTAALSGPAPASRRRLALPLAAALAAGAIAGIGGGWLAWGAPAGDDAAFRAIADVGLSAHHVYVAERRHAVEVGADETDHLSAWLSNRLDAPIAPPDLSPDGLNLLGGRLVAEAGRPGALLMYEAGEGGDRYTVFVLGTESPGETPLRYARAGDNCAYYWVDGRLAYVVSGPDDPARVREIARAVYAQVE